MSPNEIVLKMAVALNGARIPFMVVGSFSSNIYGIERNTQDADFVVDMKPEGLRELLAHLGPDFKVDPQLSFEGIVAAGEYYVVRHLVPLFKIELFLAGDDPRAQEHFKRARSVAFQGITLCFISPEDLISTKLRWYQADKRRTKDLDDVRGVLAVQSGKLDMVLLRRVCQHEGTLPLLEDALGSLPPVSPI